MSTKAAKLMQGTGREEYMALHGFCCAWCGAEFTPKVRSGPNRSRFCQPAHRDAWHNAQRQRARKNLDSDPRGYVHVSYHGALLLFTAYEIEAARRRGQEFTKRTTAREGAELRVEQVLALVGIRRSRLYQLMDHSGFPRGTIRPGYRHRAVWSEAAVLKWLSRRGKKRALRTR